MTAHIDPFDVRRQVFHVPAFEDMPPADVPDFNPPEPDLHLSYSEIEHLQQGVDSRAVYLFGLGAA